MSPVPLIRRAASKRKAGPMMVWGRSVVEPERGHVREDESHLVEGVSVGFAICGAFVVGDLTGPEGTFPTCSTCGELLDE